MALIKPIMGNPFMYIADKVCKNKKPYYMQQVSDSLYRGSQPDTVQIGELSKKGIKTILNLKTSGKKELAPLVAEAEKHGMKYVNIPLSPFNIKKCMPYLKELIFSASKENPLYVHCMFGKDRTGFVTALAQIIKEKVPTKDAIKEMLSFGFNEKLFFMLENYLKKIGKLIKP